MRNREDVIIELQKQYDPRSARWEYRAIMDSLQDCEDTCTMKDLERVIKEKYDCELFTYSSLYNQVQSLIEQGIVLNNPITKRLCLKQEYIIVPETRFLPISNYNVGLFSISVLATAWTLYSRSPHLQTAILIMLVGALYLLLQYIGSEWTIPTFNFKSRKP